MAVSTEVDHNDYTGNGVTTSFPYTFRIFHKSDLVVQVVDLSENITELTLDTDYTVTGAGGYTGGNVVLSSPLANGYQISISRELPFTQETDLRNQGKFFAEVHEDAFDKLTMLIQQVRSWLSLALRKPSFVANYYDALGNYIRNIKDPRDPQDAATKNYVDSVSDSNFSRTLRTPEVITQLPSALTRANKIVGFDASGNPIMLVPESGSAADVLLLLAGPNGYTYIPSLQIQQWRDRGDIRGWGCMCDGVTIDTVNFQNAINDNKLTGKPCIVPEGVTLTGPLTLYSKTTIRGQGQERTKLKLLAGSINALLYGANSNSLWGTNSLLGEDGIIVENLTIDADRANSPNGSAIAIYGPRTRINKVNIINSGKNGIRTEWADSGFPNGGMEGSFSEIVIDKSGEHGWRFAGPHDSVVSDVIIISSGQKTASTYSNLWLEKGNARWSQIHTWTSADDLRAKFSLHIGRPSEGNEFSLSHFEGADNNVFIEGNNNVIDDSCRVYYPYNGINIRLAGSSCIIEAKVGEEHKGIGLPLAKGIVFDGTYGGPSNSHINIMANGQDAGALDMAGSGGGNLIRVRGYNGNASGIAYLGSPLPTDTVDLVITGPNLTWFKSDIAITRHPVANVTATGTTQSTATPLSNSAVTVNITAGGGGGGVRLPSATLLKSGAKITVANTTGAIINVYPFPGHNILGQGVDMPLALAGLKSAEFTVIDGDAGLWVVLKGA
ncbi:hypothetical protein IPA75_003580 [Escherichia coli]|nr:hypothetical protein [Escherichia coli]